ncbi:MAG TPA: hypothetical protein PLK88_03910, partial [Methanothrix sp.]|nr:hypothetical protein [Methanothrix sp.]
NLCLLGWTAIDGQANAIYCLIEIVVLAGFTAFCTGGYNMLAKGNFSSDFTIAVGNAFADAINRYLSTGEID